MKSQSISRKNMDENLVVKYIKDRRKQLIEKKTTKFDSSLKDLQMRVIFSKTKKSNSKRTLKKKTYNIFESSSDEPMDEPPQYELKSTKHSKSIISVKKEIDKKIINHFDRKSYLF